MQYTFHVFWLYLNSSEGEILILSYLMLLTPCTEPREQMESQIQYPASSSFRPISNLEMAPVESKIPSKRQQMVWESKNSQKELWPVNAYVLINLLALVC